MGKCSPVPVTYIRRPSLGKLLISTITTSLRGEGTPRWLPEPRRDQSAAPLRRARPRRPRPRPRTIHQTFSQNASSTNPVPDTIIFCSAVIFLISPSCDRRLVASGSGGARAVLLTHWLSRPPVAEWQASIFLTRLYEVRITCSYFHRCYFHAPRIFERSA